MTTVIDFSNLSAGDVVTNQFQSDGVTISATGGSGDAIIFDTANPTGGDGDLATNNLGNVLIISEDGDSTDPDDNAGGGTVAFAFETASIVKSLTFLDIEETAEIKLYDADGNIIDTIHVGATNNNGQKTVHIDVANVANMEVTLHGSGAIDNLEFVASAGPDFIVEGTSDGDLIDTAYDQDPEGDMIDAGDNQVGNDDDSVRAGAGDDTVYAGDGDDTVDGGSGDDLIFGDDDGGDQGDDVLLGEDGDDTLCGMGGNDTLDGGAGADLLEGMDGDDLLLGGSGADRAYGDDGNDTIFGDSGTQDDGSVREVFQWDLGPSNASDFSQDTGNVIVSFSEVNGGASDNIASNTQNVSGIDTGGAVADDASSLDSETDGEGNSDTYTLGFSDPVENVSFRVNDIDGDGVVTIKAFDENGDPIEVQLAGGSNLTMVDTDGDGLADTADSNGGYLPDTSDEYSVLVTIPGPVSEIEIFHTQDGSDNSGINVTDVYFDVPGVNPSEGAGDDTLVGGEGDDLIYGEGGDDSIEGGTGDDTLEGGEGADMIEGGDDADLIVGGNAGDVVDGGTGSTAPGDANDNDVLDLTGEGPFRVINETEDADGNSTSGTIQFLDGAGEPTGDTMTFTEIETILGERVNTDPDAEDDVINLDEDTDATFNPLDNDSDPDLGDTLTVTDISDPANGTLTDNGDGTFTYTPDENFNGTDSVTYVVSDGNGGSDSATVTFNVAPVNDAPDAVDDGDVTDFETAVEINLLANDSDIDGDTLTVTEATVPATQGSLTPTATEGVYIFTPADDFEGTATVSYTISDGNGGTDSAVHTIEVGADPTPPDGVVDGEDFAEVMGPGYNDENDPTDGGGDIIDGPDGDDDVIEGNGGDDTINAGQGSDTVSGGEGNDSIEGGASPDGDDLSGDEGDDTVLGGGGDDTIDGGEGDDVLDGGADDDDITGGDGNDSVIGGGGNDTIDTSGSETLLDTGWPGYGPIPPVAPDADPDNDKDTVFAGEGNDSVTTGDDADVVDAGTGDDTVDAGIDDDSIQGGQGNDLLIGSEGNDTISGGQDDDTIFGGLDTADFDNADIADDGFGAPFGPDPLTDNNSDSIDGGAGNDLIFGQDDDDTITGGTGNDTIDGGVDDDSISGGAGDDSLLGDHGDDVLQGNFGDDTLEGGRGSDTLEGNGDDDLILGGAGDSIIGGGDSDTIIIDQDEVDSFGDNDTAIFADGSGNGDDRDTLDLTDFVSYRNLVETVDGDGDSTSGSVEVKNDEDEWVEVTFAEIENLLLPPKEPDGIVDGEDFAEIMGPGYDDANPPTDGGGDQIDGDDGLDDVIEGNGGDDTIDAGLGDDTVSGGTGDDVIEGGSDDGADSIDGDDGNDSITGGDGNDTIDGGDDNDTVRGEDGDDVVSGGDGEDSVTGGAGDDTLDGGEGDDSLTGGSGDDVIDGGEGNDSITGSSGNDSITDLDGDNLITAGPDGLPDRGFPFVGNPDPDPTNDLDTVTTGDGDDTISTGDDDDVINAGNGNNVIDSGFDDDSVVSGTGTDLITSGEGSDTVNAGDGDDTIYGGLGPVLGTNANLIDDNVNPANNDDILDNGDDSLDGGGGNDLIFGEDDNDRINGGSGNDTIDGGIDDDTLVGGLGDDLIIGGQGEDSMRGGDGDDTFQVGTFVDPVFGDTYLEGIGDDVQGGEDADDGDIDVLDLTGAGSLKVIYDDNVDPGGEPGESGIVIFYTDNTQTEEAGRLEFKEIENVIPCFTPGAMIATPKGEVPVETLREGDKVITRDNGIQEIRWTGKRTLNRGELADHLNMKPIFIKAGALGHNLPERDMLVSPQHRVLITGETPQLYFEESEVLVAAKHLIGRSGIGIMDTMRTTYIHFMFDRHEVVLSDGAWTESFQPGDQTLGSMGEASREEIFALFPELATQDGLTDYAAARRSLKAHEAKLLQL